MEGMVSEIRERECEEEGCRWEEERMEEGKGSWVTHVVGWCSWW